jgi:transcription initiation factor IIE alpha subunit
MASSLQETKVMLLVASRQLSGAFQSINEAMPNHTNTTDAPLAQSLHDVQTELAKVMAKVREAAGKI